ncbi:hypothetical protein [Senegalia massiliensis]|uniref:hypothetical protein n=1 Tax=Senegalia massiliensis TaxID=1720316 RepID=UPI0010305865|nr:hypothetical protein [Senegalia massiliensis]
MKKKKLLIIFIIISTSISPLIILADKITNSNIKEIVKLDIKSTLINLIGDYYLTDEEIEINYTITPNNIKKDLIDDNSGLINNVEIIKLNENPKLNKFGASYTLNNNHYNYDDLEDIFLLYSSKSYDEVKNKLNNLDIQKYSNKNGNGVPLQSYYKNKNKLEDKTYFHNNQIPLFELNDLPIENSEDYLNGEFYAYVLAVDSNYDVIELKKSNYPVGNNKIGSIERIIDINYKIPSEIKVIEDQNFRELGLSYEDGRITGSLNQRLVYKLLGDYYKATPITFNIKFKSSKRGTYNLPNNNSEISFESLKDPSVISKFTIPPTQVRIENFRNNIKIEDMGLFYNNNISYNYDNIDLAIENKYNLGVEFTSNNINARNTDIDIYFNKDNVKINSYKLYKYDINKEQFLMIKDGVKYNGQENKLKLNILDRGIENRYILVYTVKSDTIFKNIKNTVIFNKSTSLQKKVIKNINFVELPSVD